MISRLAIRSLSKLLELGADALWCGIRYTVKLVIVRWYKGICAGRCDRVLSCHQSLQQRAIYPNSPSSFPLNRLTQLLLTHIPFGNFFFMLSNASVMYTSSDGKANLIEARRATCMGKKR